VGNVYIDNQWDLLGVVVAAVAARTVAVERAGAVGAMEEHLMFQHKEFPKDERNSG
jgi:hypothetical protein